MAKSTTQKDGILACMNVIKNEKVDSETLTVLCYKAFQSLYSMDLFKEYPRMDKVTRILREHVEKGFIKEEDGRYQITSKGLEWGSKNSKLVRFAASKIITEKKEILSFNMNEEELSREFSKLRRTTAYDKYKKNRDHLTIMDFMDFLRIDIYATKQLFDRKVSKIKAICSKDEQLNKIFLFMSEKFGEDYTGFKYQIDKLIG